MHKLVLLLICFSSLLSCQVRQAPTTSFLPNSYRLEDGQFFQKEWSDPAYNIDNFDKVAIAPISTTFLRDLGWWDKKNASTYTENRPDGPGPGFKHNGNETMGKQLTRYFEEKMAEAFMKTRNSRFKLVDYGKMDKKTIILTIALVEVVPVKKYLPGAQLLGDGSLRGGTIAIEGQIKQAKTNKVLAMFKDRKVNTDNIDYLDGTKSSFYDFARPIIKDWSKRFVTLSNKWELEQLPK
ncbi:MAG: DUF3313 domain-containing protein [Lentisphaeraceae bacterium]|nr:DUF3313 domain-containing protein [Lentisphaeraceae bacterium]